MAQCMNPSLGNLVERDGVYTVTASYPCGHVEVIATKKLSDNLYQISEIFPICPKCRPRGMGITIVQSIKGIQISIRNGSRPWSHSTIPS